AASSRSRSSRSSSEARVGSDIPDTSPFPGVGIRRRTAPMLRIEITGITPLTTYLLLPRAPRTRPGSPTCSARSGTRCAPARRGGPRTARTPWRPHLHPLPCPSCFAPRRAAAPTQRTNSRSHAHPSVSASPSSSRPRRGAASPTPRGQRAGRAPAAPTAASAASQRAAPGGRAGRARRRAGRVPRKAPPARPARGRGPTSPGCGAVRGAGNRATRAPGPGGRRGARRSARRGAPARQRGTRRPRS
ncbi:hypothetical protein DFJ74DRAFT_733171, partial [Hyaloraphidium curvatum]